MSLKVTDSGPPVLWKPDLNKRKDFERLILFRNGVT